MKDLIVIIADETSERAKSQGYQYGIDAWHKMVDKWCVDINVVQHNTLDVRPQFLKYDISHLFVMYDRIMVVDADTMPNPNNVSIFDRYADPHSKKICAVPNFGSMEWVLRGLENYQYLFPGIKVDYSEYINTGLMIFKRKNAKMLNSFLSFVLDNQKEIENLTDQLGMGQDQTLFNLFLKQYNGNIEAKEYIDFMPWTWNTQDLPRRFALTEDLFVTEMSNVLHFNCGCKPSPAYWMEKAYNKLWKTDE